MRKNGCVQASTALRSKIPSAVAFRVIEKISNVDFWRSSHIEVEEERNCKMPNKEINATYWKRMARASFMSLCFPSLNLIVCP